MERGWFPIHRKIFDSDVWAHPTARIVWIYLLGMAAHAVTKTSARYQCIVLEPGQILVGRESLAKKCGLSGHQVRTALAYLKSTSRISIKSTNRFSVITVINWPIYRDAMLNSGQQDLGDGVQQASSRRPAGVLIQEGKKLRSEEKTKPRSSEELPTATTEALLEVNPEAKRAHLRSLIISCLAGRRSIATLHEALVREHLDHNLVDKIITPLRAEATA